MIKKALKVIFMSALLCPFGISMSVSAESDPAVDTMDYETLLVHQNEHADEIETSCAVTDTVDGEYSFTCSEDGITYRVIVPALNTVPEKETEITDTTNEEASLQVTTTADETKISLPYYTLDICALETGYSVSAVVESSESEIPLIWTSDHPEIVSVDVVDSENAVLTAHKAGTAVITVATENEADGVAELKVTVANLLNGLNSDPANNKQGIYYYKNGIIQNITGVKKIDNAWYNLVRGQVRGNTVAENENGWWRIDSTGKVDFNYQGFAENSNGWWYIRGGKVQFNTNSVIKGTVDRKSVV